VQLALTQTGSKLEIDNLVMEVIDQTLINLGYYSPDKRIHTRLKKNHLATIERAKAYITENFCNDISLLEIAGHCCVSPFHFSRIFKTFTRTSPHQFLLSVRLKNAELLLKNTKLPVADAAFSSGFNSIEYFTSAFRQRYHCPPALFRKNVPA